MRAFFLVRRSKGSIQRPTVEPDGQAAYLLRMPIIVIQHSETSSAAIIGDAIVRHGLRIRTIRVAAGEALPSDLDGIDGIISMGGSHSANDDRLPWIDQELALLKAACAAQLPVLGVCLGAQLLARALGGTVSKMSGTPSVGLCRIDLTTAGWDDPLFRGLPWYGSWPSWHEEEISELPPDARVLAKSEDCGVEAFAHGIFAYGVQFHPEWTADRVGELCDDPSEHLADADFDYAAVKAVARDEADSIDRMARRFAENVASYLMPVERVNAGIPKDIHH
ncbi:MAG: type 1 glutamine amidotransferase [Planctomycetota bacterium]|jgi:GMP synthase (glutamine-hydrolysing)|nr:type 1 glutamine amidotransferase [Planctomycetota bacterium]